MSEVLHQQNYSIAETGRLLRVAGTTLHRWAQGWVSNGKQQAPMITTRAGRLSFQDLAELSVVAQLRMHNISVLAIREAAAEIRRSLGVERPFLQGVLVSEDCREIFFDYLGALISTKKHDQAAMPKVVRAKMIRPERLWLEDGLAMRVYPFSREEQDRDPKLVAIDPRYRFGRPVTNPSLIDIDGLILRLRCGETFEEIADVVRPEKGIPELEEGVRYWLSTMTPAMRKRVDASPPSVVARVSAFRGGASVVQIARDDRVRPRTALASLSQALELAVAA